MKKILILANSSGGLYNFRRELLEALIEKNNQVIVSTPMGPKINLIEEIGCIVKKANIKRHGKNPLEELKLLRYYDNLIKEVQPDGILTYTIKPNIYGGITAKRSNVPYIANITGLGTAVENPGILQKIAIGLYKVAFTDIQTVFFQNKENRQFFIDHNIATEKHKILPGSGVNLNHFLPLEYPSSGAIEFVYISRIMEDKGIDEFLNAAEFIKNKYPNTKFHICGFLDGDYETTISEYQDKEIIEYHGMIQDVRTILEKTHCTILPSYHEGMSNALLESAASGRPVLASDIPGCRETFDEGISGFGFEPRSTESLIQAIEKFIKLPYEEKKAMGEAGRHKVEKEFDRQIVVDAYMQEIEKILEG